MSNVVNETNFDLWKTVAPFFKKKVDHHHIRFCALAGYGWSKWRGQELWGNCYGQKGRSKVIFKSSIIGFVCWSEGLIQSDFIVFVFRISDEGVLQVTRSLSLATVLHDDYSTVWEYSIKYARHLIKKPKCWKIHKVIFVREFPHLLRKVFNGMERKTQMVTRDTNIPNSRYITLYKCLWNDWDRYFI